MIALDGKRPAEAFRLSYLFGVLFFVGTLSWFIHVTVVGAALLVLYLSLYPGIFGAGYSFFASRDRLFKIFLLPSVWVALEFARAHFLTGFGWASLGQSQYKVLPVIQIADVTGMPGVSFLIVMVNTVLKEIWALGREKGWRTRKEMIAPVAAASVALAIVLGYGITRLNFFKGTTKGIAIAVVQANIPQEMKWHPPAWPQIMQRYMALTEKAAAEKPDLIIWPETSYPGILWEDKDLFEELKVFVRKLQVPLFIGSVTGQGEAYYNSAILLSGDGDIFQQYHKIHLVPFGEYIPFRSMFPFLERIVPIADFTSGREYTVFPFLSGAPGKFSVLICFEDTVARLSREFARAGAQVLVNITNDAWFQDTKAPFMHLQSSVFRTVENRRWLVRAANTGVSCFIDPLGRIRASVEDREHKKTYVPGYAVYRVGLGEGKTFYTHFGDVFAFACLGCIIGAIFIRERK
jgi:apolipoprotein N-acyltransferase